MGVYPGYSRSGFGITEYTEYQFAKETEYFWRSDLGNIVSAHASVALARRLKKVSRKFATRNVEIWPYVQVFWRVSSIFWFA